MEGDLTVTESVTEKLAVDYLKQARIEFDARWQDIPKKSDLRWEELHLLRKLGGTFGNVILALHKKSGNYMAMKIVEKEKAVRLKIVDRIYGEKQLLYCVDFRFILKIYFHSHDYSYAYLALEFVEGGDMFSHLNRFGRLQEDWCKFYAAQLCMALEYLHVMDIIYRDLKPENTLIDASGYLKLSDFECSKRVKGRTWTICGTPDYIAPEVILAKGYCKSVDWWGLGVFLYELCAGYPPFSAPNHLSTYQKIVAGKIRYPGHFSDALKDLLDNLIQRDPTKRYGNLKGGVFDIVNHSWFQSIDLVAIYTKTMPAPFLPAVDITSEDEVIPFVRKNDGNASKVHFQDAFADF